jgi:hypothetical protein
MAEQPHTDATGPQPGQVQEYMSLAFGASAVFMTGILAIVHRNGNPGLSLAFVSGCLFAAQALIYAFKARQMARKHGVKLRGLSAVGAALASMALCMSCADILIEKLH